MTKRVRKRGVATSAESPRPESSNKRSTVLRAAGSAFAKLGYQGTSLGDICEGAGIAKPTVYHYFPSKSAILYQLLDDWLELMITTAEAPERLEMPPTQRLLAVMKDMVGWLDSHPGEVRCYYENSLTFLTLAERKRLRRRREQFTQHVEGILLDGREAGFFRFDDPRMTRLCIFAVCGWPQMWYRPEGPDTTEDIATRAYALIMAGLDAQHR